MLLTRNCSYIFKEVTSETNRAEIRWIVNGIDDLTLQTDDMFLYMYPALGNPVPKRRVANAMSKPRLQRQTFRLYEQKHIIIQHSSPLRRYNRYSIPRRHALRTPKRSHFNIHYPPHPCRRPRHQLR